MKLPIFYLNLFTPAAWIIKYKQSYLSDQSFFNPYPEELIDIKDLGQGRQDIGKVNVYFVDTNGYKRDNKKLLRKK